MGVRDDEDCPKSLSKPPPKSPKFENWGLAATRPLPAKSKPKNATNPFIFGISLGCFFLTYILEIYDACFVNTLCYHHQNECKTVIEQENLRHFYSKWHFSSFANSELFWQENEWVIFTRLSFVNRGIPHVLYMARQ